MDNKRRCLRFYDLCKRYKDNVEEIKEINLMLEDIKIKQTRKSSIDYDKIVVSGSSDTTHTFNFELMDKKDRLQERKEAFVKENNYIDYVLSLIKEKDNEIYTMIVECYIEKKPHKVIANKHYVSRSKMYRDMNRAVLPIIK